MQRTARTGRIGRVSIRGIDGIVANLHAADEYIKEEVGSLNRVVASRVVQIAQRLVPVDTGRMWGSIKPVFTEQGLRFYVHFDPADFEKDGVAYYPPFVEFGTSRMAAQPSLTPAWAHERASYKRGITIAVQRAIGRLRTQTVSEDIG